MARLDRPMDSTRGTGNGDQGPLAQCSQVEVVLVQLADGLSGLRRQAVLEFGMGHDRGLRVAQPTDQVLHQLAGATEAVFVDADRYLLAPQTFTTLVSPALAWSSSARWAAR